jgi:hypothetical protein
MKRAWPFVLLILLFLAIGVRTNPPVGRPEPHAPTIASSAPVPESPEAVVAVEPPPTPPPTPEEPPPKTPTSGRSVVRDALCWLTHCQNPDGSWGDGPVTLGGRPIGKIGVTALALLSLFDGGYSHLSRDGFDEDKPVGPMVDKALHWLMEQRPGDSFDQALATLAINEAYGMTGSPKFRLAALDSLDSLLRLQGSDGSWGGPEPTAWAARAIMVAQLNDHETPPHARESLLRYLQATPHPANVANRILLTRDRPSTAAEAAALAQNRPPAEGRDFSEWYHASLSLFQYDGPDGPLWKAWVEPLKNAILPVQQSDGSWLGGSKSHQVVRVGLATQSLAIYYRYANVFMANR